MADGNVVSVASPTSPGSTERWPTSAAAADNLDHQHHDSSLWKTTNWRLLSQIWHRIYVHLSWGIGGKHSVKLYKRLGKSCVYIDTCINVYSYGNLPIIIVSRLLAKCNKARRCAKSNPLLKIHKCSCA